MNTLKMSFYGYVEKLFQNCHPNLEPICATVQSGVIRSKFIHKS